MYMASVFVERLADLPSIVDEELRQMLGIRSWEEQVAAPADEPHFDYTVDWYRTESQRNAKDCALEGDWKNCLSVLIKMLLEPGADDLQVNTSEEGKLDRKVRKIMLIRRTSMEYCSQANRPFS
jgi:hypothetical protein